MTMVAEPVFLPNKGIDLTKPEQFLNKQLSPYSRNMMFENERIQGRPGFIEFDAYAFPDAILLVDQFWKEDSSYDLMVCTARDVAKYDFGNTRYDFLTPLYTTGTIEVQVGTPTILRGTGTSWLANIAVGDFVKLGAGSVHSDSTWYEVTVVTSNVLLTVASAMPTTAAGASYVARQTFDGSDTDLWSRTEFLDDNLGEIWCATNGIDTPIYYDGTGQVQFFTGLPTGFTTAKYISQFFNRIVFGWCVEGGQNQPIRIRWCQPSDITDWDDLHVNDLEQPDFTYWIVGMTVFNDYMIIPKEGGAYVMRPVDSDAIFEFAFTSIFLGNFAAFSVINIGGSIYYFGYENRFRKATLIDDTPLFDPIAPFTRALDPNLAQFIYGYQLEYKDQIRWMLPYDSGNGVQPVVYFDYKEKVIEIWEYVHAEGFGCIGEYLNVTDLYVDDAVWGEYYVDEQDDYWDARSFAANAPIILYGGRDGIVYTADIGLTDNGEVYPRILDTARLDFKKPHIRKRMFRQQWWFDKETSGTATIKMKKDDKSTFEPTTKEIDLTSALKDIIKKTITWDKDFENVKMRVEANNHFALHGFINWMSDKGRTFKK